MVKFFQDSFTHPVVKDGEDFYEVFFGIKQADYKNVATKKEISPDAWIFAHDFFGTQSIQELEQLPEEEYTAFVGLYQIFNGLIPKFTTAVKEMQEVGFGETIEQMYRITSAGKYKPAVLMPKFAREYWLKKIDGIPDVDFAAFETDLACEAVILDAIAKKYERDY